QSTDFCRFRYCCWIGCRTCFYWTWSWLRYYSRTSCRRYCKITLGRRKNTRYFIT
ncbi:Lysophospholipid acyltransferase 5, partial [Bienertia sinuspersici]